MSAADQLTGKRPTTIIIDDPAKPSERMITREVVLDFLQNAENGPGLPPDLAEQTAAALARHGFIVEGAPTARRILADAQTFAERTILAELAVRLFRFFVLGSIVLPDTPAVMDWLKSYIDGSPDQGPLGAGPMLWPVMCPSADRVLRQWGFEATPGPIPYVIKRRG